MNASLNSTLPLSIEASDNDPEGHKRAGPKPVEEKKEVAPGRRAPATFVESPVMFATPIVFVSHKNHHRQSWAKYTHIQIRQQCQFN